MDFWGQVWKQVWEMVFFGLKLGLDLAMRATHPHQKFQGVPRPGIEILQLWLTKVGKYKSWLTSPGWISPVLSIQGGDLSLT